MLQLGRAQRFTSAYPMGAGRRRFRNNLHRCVRVLWFAFADMDFWTRYANFPLYWTDLFGHAVLCFGLFATGVYPANGHFPSALIDFEHKMTEVS